MLKNGGRCASIVPDGVLFGSRKAHVEIRKEIVENHRLEAIIFMLLFWATQLNDKLK